MATLGQVLVAHHERFVAFGRTVDDGGGDDVLAGYDAEIGLHDHVAATLAGYVALRRASEVMWLIAHGFDPAPTMPKLAAALAS